LKCVHRLKAKLSDKPWTHAETHRGIDDAAVQRGREAGRKEGDDGSDLFGLDQSAFRQSFDKARALIVSHLVQGAGLEHPRVGRTRADGKDVDVTGNVFCRKYTGQKGDGSLAHSVRDAKAGNGRDAAADRAEVYQ